MPGADLLHIISS